ncbi:MAG: cyclic nucleotide-binding domain-containing protein [Gammaproteobacteria bacterium]|nr:cyclic nucleotide-binding domain-containing protein [Gammaproteobacteria bacterium]
MTDYIDSIDSLELLGDGSGFHNELCAMIEGAQMFRDFSRQDVEVFARYTRAYQVAQGDTIFREGEKGSYMCVLIEGKVDIFKRSDTSDMKKVSTIRPGKTMGEMSIIDEQAHSATGVAAEKVVLVMMTKHNLERLIEDAPGLAIKVVLKIASLMSMRLRQTTGALADYLS